MFAFLCWWGIALVLLLITMGRKGIHFFMPPHTVEVLSYQKFRKKIEAYGSVILILYIEHLCWIWPPVLLWWWKNVRSSNEVISLKLQ